MKRAMIVVILLAALATSAFAAFDTYIQFKDATGKTVSIQVANFGNTAVTPAEFSSGKLTAGHRKWAPFVITRKVDSSSPSLYAMLSTPTVSLKILIHQPSLGGVHQSPVYTIQLTGVKSSKGQNANASTEEVSLTFGTIVWRYTQNGADPKANWWHDTW